MAEIFFPPAFLAQHPAYRAHFKSAPPRSARSDRRAAAVSDVPDLDPSSIAHPTLLIAGDADRVVPAALTLSLAQYLRDTRSVVLPDVGHLSLAQAPQGVAGHLREFLV
jgi:3-oxoadipate enol-lactonase